MKKSLIAMAALAAVASAAQAQSSVTVYGILDAGYSDISRDATTAAGVSEKQKQQAFSFNNYTSSRLGVRGSEDIGGGLRANFVIETGIGSNVMAGYSQSALNYNSIARQDRGNGAANNAGFDRAYGSAGCVPWLIRGPRKYLIKLQLLNRSSPWLLNKTVAACLGA